jgi:putative transport protein
MYGVIVQSVKRSGINVPMYVALPIRKGDQLELVGLEKDVDTAVPRIGYAEVTTQKTNMTFVGLAIVLGGIVGAFAFPIDGFHFSLGSVGVLLGGLFFGWLRTQIPVFGKIPEGAVWLLDNLGLTVFIAVVGIHAGPKFISGVTEMGFSLFFAGIVASILPIFSGLLIGRYLFRLHPAYTLGCVAGSTVTTALSPIQESLESKLPTLGFSVSYAVNNILMIMGAILLILIIK